MKHEKEQSGQTSGINENETNTELTVLYPI